MQVFKSLGYVKAHAGAGLIERSYRIFRSKKTGGEVFGGQYPLEASKFVFPWDAHLSFKPFRELECVDLFIDLTREWLNPYLEHYGNSKGMGRFHVSIQDDYPPDNLKEFLAAIDFAHAYASAGRIVYVHCRGGIGRTGTFAAAFLMRRFGANATQAIEVLQELRNHDLIMRDRPAPEVRQVAWLRKNAPKLKRQG